MPEIAATEMDIFKFDLKSDCSGSGRPRESVETAAVGTRLMVVAKAWRDNPVPGVVRLYGSEYTGAVLDFLPAGANVDAMAMEEMTYRAVVPRSELPRFQFELRKDMARLENEKSPDARKQVLARLVTAPWIADTQNEEMGDVAYRTAVRRYAGDQSTAQWLLKRRKTFLYGVQYMDPDAVIAFEVERANEGSAEFQFYVGARLLKNEEPAKALPWLLRASRAGFVAADLWLGDAYKELSMHASPAREKQYWRLAERAYRQAALRSKQQAADGDPWAQVMILATPSQLARVSNPGNPVTCKAVVKVSDAYMSHFQKAYSECKEHLTADELREWYRR